MLKTVTLNDRVSYKITQRVTTDEGFLRVPAKIARTGIQEYLARELQLDGDPNRVVRVMREEADVFSDSFLSSFDGADVTLDHPPVFVDSTNYGEYSKGVIRGSGKRDGDWVTSNLIIKHQTAIDAVLKGKAEVSAGYTSILDDNVPVGADYEFIQRPQTLNHVAIVDSARAGPIARISDNNGVIAVTVLITLDSGRSIDVADANNAQLVADAFDRLNQRVTDAEAAKTALNVKVDSLNEKVEELTLASSDEAINQRVATIATVKDNARKVAGDKFNCESMDTVEIMRAALGEVRPKIEWAAKDAGYVQAAFDMALEEPIESPEYKQQIQRLANDGASIKHSFQDSDDLLEAHKRSLSNRHKQEG